MHKSYFLPSPSLYPSPQLLGPRPVLAARLNDFLPRPPACLPEKPMRLNFRRGKFQFLANVRRISFCFVFVFDFLCFSSSSSASFSALLAPFGGDDGGGGGGGVDSHVLSQRELSAGLQPLCFWGSSCAGLNSFRESRNAAAKMRKKDEQGQAGDDQRFSRATSNLQGSECFDKKCSQICIVFLSFLDFLSFPSLARLPELPLPLLYLFLLFSCFVCRDTSMTGPLYPPPLPGGCAPAL